MLSGVQREKSDPLTLRARMIGRVMTWNSEWLLVAVRQSFVTVLAE